MDDIWLIISEFVFSHMSCTSFQYLQLSSYLYYITCQTNVHILGKKVAIQLGIEMPSFLAPNVIKSIAKPAQAVA
jgi:hypothetical protein